MKNNERVFEFIQASLNLFKAVPKIEDQYIPQYTLANENNLENGFFVTVRTFQVCPYVASGKISNFIRDNYGYNIYEMNKGLYKTLGKLANLTPKEALFDRIMSYLSSFGMEGIESFEGDFLHIPNDTLKFPPTADPMRIFIVGSIANSEIKARTLKMIHSDETITDDQINSLAEIIDCLDIDFEIEDIPNTENLVKLCEKLKIVPRDPVKFLRHMVYIGTDSPLLIKNNETIENLKKSQANFDNYFSHYISENGIEKLAAIFYRFKPVWLAFKHHSEYMQTTINKIRRLADRYHKPIKPKLLRNLTTAQNIDFDELKMELSQITTYKKAALANTLLYRSTVPGNIVYNIRNGKTFVKDYSGSLTSDVQKIIDVIIDSIVEDFRPNVQGKRIYIPDNFKYAVPFSEKSFVGNIPYGSCHTFKSKSCVVGVHWLNIFRSNDEIRVDLDFHLNGSGVEINKDDFSAKDSLDTKKHKIVFSGDVSDAPLENDGATESFFVGESLTDKIMIINVKHYNRELFRLYKESKNPTVPFNLILADVDKDKIDREFLVYSYEVGDLIPFQIQSGGMFLGFLVSNARGGKKFYFCSRHMRSEIVARTTALTKKFNDTMTASLESCLSLNEILERAGAIMRNVDINNCDIDLDPSAVTKDILIGLFEK